MTTPGGALAELRPADWTTAAACTQPHTDPNWWHSDQRTEQTAARAVCNRCPVQLICAGTALAQAEPWGIRGGLNPTQRAAIATLYGQPRPGAAQHGTRSRYVAGCTADQGRACKPCKRAHAAYEHQRRLGPPRRTIIRLGTIHRPRAPRRRRPTPTGQTQLIPA